MPNILKVTKEEVAWQLGVSNINPGPQANTRLKDYLGADQIYFAPMSVTSNGYAWTSETSGWTSMANADEMQKQKIELLLHDLRTRVRQSLANDERLANGFLSLPSDTGKYIYFIDDPDGFKVIIAGWGFTNSRRKVVVPPKRVVEQDNKVDVRIGFAISGELQADHKFYLTTLSGTQKELQTDSSGYFKMGLLKPGTSLEISDPDSGKNTTFVIEADKQEYVLDITRNFQVTVTVSKDDEPAEGETVSLRYKDRDFSLTTDASGKARKSLPYFSSYPVSVSVGDIEETQMADLSGVDFIVKLTTQSSGGEGPVLPPPPPPVPARLKIVCEDQFGNPLENRPLYITVGENTEGITTGPDGTCLKSGLPAGIRVTVRDGFNATISQSAQMIAGENEIRLTVPQVVRVIYNTITMIGKDGQPMRNEKLSLRQGDQSMLLDLDENGSARFPANKFVDGRDIVAQIISPNQINDAIPFTTEPDERDYTIIISETVNRPWWKDWCNWAIMIAIFAGLSIFGIFYVHQLP